LYSRFNWRRNRIYPIPFRKLEYESQYSKYQWLELELEKNLSDPRPESYKPRSYNKIKLGEKIDSEKGTWTKRKEIVLKNVHTNLGKLIKEAKTEGVCTSLAVFKPKAIQKFKIEPVAREWDAKKLAQLEAKANQLNLFVDSQNPFKVVDKLPYKFSYEFIDDEGTPSTLMIEDWEIGQLYWNCLRTHDGNEVKACEDVKKKYYDDFALTKDLYLFLGTTREFHFMAPNPFIIIGTFHPKFISQLGITF
jgi:hypothetical protein